RRWHARQRQLEAELLHRGAGPRSAHARGPPGARGPAVYRVQGDHRRPPEPLAVMTLRRLLTILVLVVVLVTVVPPARAEAVERTRLILTVSGAIGLVAVLAVLIIANVTEHRRGIRTGEPPRGPVIVAWQAPAAAESP